MEKAVTFPLWKLGLGAVHCGYVNKARPLAFHSGSSSVVTWCAPQGYRAGRGGAAWAVTAARVRLACLFQVFINRSLTCSFAVQPKVKKKNTPKTTSKVTNTESGRRVRPSEGARVGGGARAPGADRGPGLASVRLTPAGKCGEPPGASERTLLRAGNSTTAD